jgi:hypothetical protein
MSQTEENRRLAQRLLDEVFDAGNFDAIDELVHPNFVNHEAPQTILKARRAPGDGRVAAGLVGADASGGPGLDL